MNHERQLLFIVRMNIYSFLFVVLTFACNALAFQANTRLAPGLSHVSISTASSLATQRVSSSSLFLQSDKDEGYLSTSKLWNTASEEKEETAFDKVASKGLAGVLAIAVAESIFWALGVPLAALWYKYTTGEWIDMMTTDGQLKAAGFSFGYGGFATAILQYRVTLFAIPLVPVMENLIVKPGKKFFGDKFGEQQNEIDGTPSKTVTVFGATSGVGQIICHKLKDKCNVRAISRDVDSARTFDLISDCSFIQADARDATTITPAVQNSDIVVISVGTTAFPSSKWEGALNNPEMACLVTVENILNCIESLPVTQRPKRIILLSSIGVLRRNQFPFSFLNTYGVLDYKLASEDLLQERCQSMDISSIVIRPGRLVGPPFTNFDLAKVFGITNGDQRRVVVSEQDDIQGDTERIDVADVVIGLLEATLGSDNSHKRIAVVNDKGAMPLSAWRKSMEELGIDDFVAPVAPSFELVDA